MHLCDEDIELALNSGRIGIKPRPDSDRINGASVDLRLGTRFRIPRSISSERVPIDLSILSKADMSGYWGSEFKLKAVADDLWIPPGKMALGMTAETITLPNNLVGWLDGKSMLARMGLVVHLTAHRIDPGWHGALVLEFFNCGEAALILRPGMVICAVSFEQLSGPALRPYNLRKDARFQNQTGIP